MALPIAMALIIFNNLANLIPQDVHNAVFIPLNLSVLALLIMWARHNAMTWGELGFSRYRIAFALSLGTVLGIAIPAPLFVSLALPESAETFADPRDIGEKSLNSLAYQALARIPLGTALFEEGAFRGVLYGVWEKTKGVRWAVVGSSVVFGLWHITPTWELLSGSGFFASDALLSLAIVGGVLATVVGGLFFAWLRLRTGSIYAPFMTHWLINALGAAASYLAGR